MIRRCAAAAAAALLSACATQAPLETSAASDGLSLEQRRAALAALPGWEMRGRLAVDTGERAYQARVEWRQTADRLRLSVRGPLGAGGVEVSGSDDALVVHSRGERYALDDPEVQLSELLGWWLPVASLDDWLLGLPDPGYAAESEIEAGSRLRWLEQRFWRVEYVRYELAEHWLLPSELRMSHAALSLSLTVDRWRPVSVSDERLN